MIPSPIILENDSIKWTSCNVLGASGEDLLSSPERLLVAVPGLTVLAEPVDYSYRIAMSQGSF